MSQPYLKPTINDEQMRLYRNEIEGYIQLMHADIAWVGWITCENSNKIFFSSRLRDPDIPWLIRACELAIAVLVEHKKENKPLY